MPATKSSVNAARPNPATSLLFTVRFSNMWMLLPRFCVSESRTAHSSLNCFESAGEFDNGAQHAGILHDTARDALCVFLLVWGNGGCRNAKQTVESRECEAHGCGCGHHKPSRVSHGGTAKEALEIVDRRNDAAESRDSKQETAGARNRSDFLVGEQAGDIRKVQREMLLIQADCKQVMVCRLSGRRRFGKTVIECAPELGRALRHLRCGFDHERLPDSFSADSHRATSDSRLNPPPNSRIREQSSAASRARA